MANPLQSVCRPLSPTLQPSARQDGSGDTCNAVRALLCSRTAVLWSLLYLLLCPCASAAAPLLTNSGFETGFSGWVRWGRNADLITLDQNRSHTGSNSARIKHGKNGLYFTAPITGGQAYQLRFFYRLEGSHPAGRVTLGYFKKGGALRSGGSQIFDLTPEANLEKQGWQEFKEVFLPTRITVSAQFLFTAQEDAVLWVDDVIVEAVPRPEGLKEPTAPWAGLDYRTPEPKFEGLLTREPGRYTVVSWAHDLNPRDKAGGFKSEAYKDPERWTREMHQIFQETGEAGMGFLDLPGHLDGAEPWRTPAFHRKQFKKYGVRFDVWTEGSGTTAAALKRGAELLNAPGKALGARPVVSIVDPAYVSAQAEVLRRIAEQLKDESFVGFWYGKDEPSIHLPDGPASGWGKYGQAMAQTVLKDYGFGRFAAPEPKREEFQKDSAAPLRWIAYNRWANDRFIETRRELNRVLHEVAPEAKYSPADYWFMSGFHPFDYSRVAACGDLMECDPYASSAEREPGRGVFNHGFGAKFMADLTGKPVRIIAQAFDYAGYDMRPEDLREWLSQSLRCGASAINYYTMDSPRTTHPDRWRMMLHLSKVITHMNRLALPASADTAVLYTVYTHMSHGASTTANELYTAHALVGELAGSWHRFVSDTQIERGEVNLQAFKVIYLPLAKYMTPQTVQKLADYIRAGGVLICTDPETFTSDLESNRMDQVRQQVLGIKNMAPRRKSADPETITFSQNQFGLTPGSSLPLPTQKAANGFDLEPADGTVVLGKYADGKPALISKALGKGRVITFGSNPMQPGLVLDPGAWLATIKEMQRSFGCQVELPIWHFVLPLP